MVRELWERADCVAHGLIRGTIPKDMRDAAIQHPFARDLWAYLESRFADRTLVSLAAMWPRLFQCRLEDLSGVSYRITALNKVEQDLLSSKRVVDPSLIPRAILFGMGDRFPICRDLLLNLPLDEHVEVSD